MDEALKAVAAAYGVATEYDDQRHERVQVAPTAVRAVLRALGADPDAPPPPAGTGLPSTVVVVAGRTPALPDAPASVQLEDGTTLSTSTPALGELPLGWHRLTVGAEEATLVVTPERAPRPPRSWGWMVQLYAIRSAGSWGIGDLRDLANLAVWSARDLGAGLILVNPLHAVAPVLPIETSPYFPTSRRFVNPLYLRVEDLPEYAAADAATRAKVDALGAPLRAQGRSDRIDRDAAWTAKLAACELLAGFAIPEPAPGASLRDFATWCALAEVHGRDFRTWPDAARDPSSATADQRRVDFHVWLQRRCADQLAAAQRAATEAGMPVGIVHDLAVGVDPGGADAWALRDALATTATIGAPPEVFNQRGQNWSLPPWHPERLAAAGYAPYRDMLRAVLGRGGGIRIDHVLGLFRLWWVPAGATPPEGSYVRYDDDALLGILVLEAQRAGAVVIGEDLGTVEPRMLTALAARGVLGCSVLWFEQDPQTGLPLPAERWRELALGSLTTHDLPTAAGFLSLEHVKVRDELGQFTRPVVEERAAAERDRADLLTALGDPGDPVLAMHEFLAGTPSLLVVGQPADAVGDLRQPNLPGTTGEYPNWKLPLARPDGQPVTLEDLQADARVRAVGAALGRNRSVSVERLR